jgi:phosphatidate cytidylyltransferase
MEQRKRIASAVVILPPLLLFLYYAPPMLFLLLVLTLVVLGLREYFAMLALVPLSACVKTSYLVASLFVLTAYVGGERWMSMALFLGFAALTVSALLSLRPGGQRFPLLLHSLFGVVFIGWSLSHLILLRSYPAGRWYIFFLCMVVWIGDSAAMYVGKGLGRHKMAPTVSPGKTWEGAVGGVLGGVLVAVVGARVLVPQSAWWQNLVLGVLVSLAAQIGDLGESMLKRYVGVKDSGTLIPGHGGLLDRIDSVLFAAPTLVYALDFLLHAYSP